MIKNFQHKRVHLWMVVSFSIFFLAGLLGLLMRYMGIGNLSIDYKYILHAHSHTALLGFGFIFIIGAFIFLLFPQSIYHRAYKRLLFVHLALTILMGLSFLYQGYGPISITFSTLMLLVSYMISHYILKDYKNIKSQLSNPMIPLSIFWYLLSTIPLWTMGPVMVLLGRDHPLYFLTIQLFLHLQFNGWFTFAVIGLLIFYVRSRNIKYDLSRFGFYTLILSLFLTFCLNISAAIPHRVYFLLNSAGVILQLIAFIIILRPLLPGIIRTKSSQNPRWISWIFGVGIVSLLLKVIIQTLVAVPEYAIASYTIRNYTVGFIHLLMIGSCFMTVAGLLLKTGFLPNNHYSKWGWLFFMTAYIISEIILFAQATLTWIPGGYFPYYNTAIFWISALYPLGIGMILIGLFYRVTPENKEVGL